MRRLSPAVGNRAFSFLFPLSRKLSYFELVAADRNHPLGYIASSRTRILFPAGIRWRLVTTFEVGERRSTRRKLRLRDLPVFPHPHSIEITDL